MFIINFGDENIYFGAKTILFGGALNGCLFQNTAIIINTIVSANMGARVTRTSNRM
jgi:hypothetical protein